MTRILSKTHLLSTGFGLAMAAAAGIHTAGAVSILAIVAVLAVGAGIWFRPASTLAVLLAAGAVMLTDGPPLATGLAGLAGAYYLILRHTERESKGLAGAPTPAMVAALGFAVISVSAASLPLDLPWLPILAPPTMFLAYMLCIQPFLSVAVAARRAT